jgi:hypothetical protein
MVGMNMFHTFEEEHMESTSLPRYNTRARARQHSATQAQFLAPWIFRPIAFKNNQGVDVAPRQSTHHIPMANAVINQDTGASTAWSTATSYKMIIHSQSGTKQQKMSLDVWPKVLGEELKDPTQYVLSHAKQYPKEKLLLMDILWWTSIPTKLRLTESTSLWVAT